MIVEWEPCTMGAEVEWPHTMLYFPWGKDIGGYDRQRPDRRLA